MRDESINQVAVKATLHCLTGCAIGEILGNIIGAGLGWSTMATEALAIPLAFLFGYSFTVRPLLKGGLGFRKSAKLALASDTFSIATMEIVDTLIIVLIPGAVSAGPANALFWGSLAIALTIAFFCAVPVNRYLIARGKGHAVLHEHH
jgi:hypothetical protein